MRRSFKSGLSLCALTTTLLGGALAYGQTPLGTAFTYQGQLKQSGSPANGSFAMDFKLFDAASAGSQVGPTVSLPTVGVANGLFTVPLDFGVDAYAANQARWLEITVSGTMLSPRQPLTASPNALYAKNNWALNGNAGTDPANHFLGTPDNQPLSLRVNNTRAMQYEYAENVAFRSINVIGGNETNSIVAGVVGATIAGGGDSKSSMPNQVSGDFSTISGGVGNNAYSYYDVIAGGFDNHALGGIASIGGGIYNWAYSDYATIGGGSMNAAHETYAAILGGNSNSAGGFASAVGGGEDNNANFTYAAIPGGKSNSAGGFASLAAGYRAKANHGGAFVWADTTDTDFASTAQNQFLIRASGGVGIGTTSPASPLSIAGDIDISGSRLHVGTNGNVGIGTTAPQGALDIKGRLYLDPDGMNASPGISLAIGQGGTGLDSIGGVTLNLWSAGFDTMSVVAGYVGIGIDFPLERLHIPYGNLRIDNGEIQSSGPITLHPDVDQTGDDIVRFVDRAGNENMRIDAGGNVGIRTTAPAHPLTVMAGSYGIQQTNGICDISTWVDESGGWLGTERDCPLNFFTADGGIQMTLVQNGNFGIGTSAPAEKLHVVGNIKASGSVFASCGTLTCSDKRFKSNIEPISNALALVEKLRPVRFDWKREEFRDHQFAKGRQLGLIAQEVREVAPEVVQEGSDGYLSVDYGRLTPILAQAIKEQQAENRALKARIDALERRLSDILDKNAGGAR